MNHKLWTFQTSSEKQNTYSTSQRQASKLQADIASIWFALSHLFISESDTLLHW